MGQDFVETSVNNIKRKEYENNYDLIDWSKKSDKELVIDKAYVDSAVNVPFETGEGLKISTYPIINNLLLKLEEVILSKKILISNPSAWTKYSEEGSEHLRDILKVLETIHHT